MQRKHLLWAGGAAAAVVALLWFVMSGGFNTSGSSTASANEGPATSTTTLAPLPGECGAEKHYYAYDAPAGSHNFNADQSATDVGTTYNNWRKFMASDPLFLATMVTYLEQGVDLDKELVYQRAAQYESDRAAWQAACDNVVNNTAAARTGTSTEDKYTLGMLPGADPSVRPDLVKTDTALECAWSFYFTWNGEGKMKGKEAELCGPCGFQPRESSFTTVPSVSQALAPPPPPPTPEQPQPEQPPGGEQPPCVDCDQPECQYDCGGTPPCQYDCGGTTPPCQYDCGGGKHASETPVLDAPIVPAPDGGYVDRGGNSHPEPYVPPAPTPAPGKAPAQQDSGPGAVNTTVAPPASTTVAVPDPTGVVEGTVEQE